MKQAIILAAGLGTRLMPLTATRSKAMVPVLGKPLVELVIDTLLANNIDDFVFVVGPDDKEIRPYFDGRCGLRSRFVVQYERLGMAHALKLAAPEITGPFVLSACDSFTSAQHISELITAFGDGDAALSLLDVEPDLVCRSAAVELERDVVLSIVEKPKTGETRSNTVSLPLYLFSEAVLPMLEDVDLSSRGEYEIQDAIKMLIAKGRRIVGVRAEKRLQVSSPRDLLDLTMTMLRDYTDDVVPVNAGLGCTFRQPFYVDSGVIIERNCTIGPNVYLERGCEIGSGSTIENAIVQRDARVAPGSNIMNQIV